ncbi:MAG: oligopeptidase B [Roseiflexaceae bacterium]
MPNLPIPPVAERRPRTTVVFDTTIHDDYYWLRERDNPEVIAHIEAENSYTEAVMQPTVALQEQLFAELVSFVKADDHTAPAPYSPYLYYEKTLAGQQYKQICRRLGPDGPEEILIDENQLADQQIYFASGVYRLNPSQTLLAYTTDTNGSERFHLYIKDLRTGALIDRPIDNVTYDIEWADDQHLFYAIPDQAWRTFQLFRHQIGSDPQQDELVFHEPDESYWVNLSRTQSGQFLVINSKSNTTSKLFVLPTDQPTGTFRELLPAVAGVERWLDHSGAFFYLRTNEDALNFQIVRIPVEAPSADPEVVVAHSDQIAIDWMIAFANHLAVFEREHGLEQLRIVDLHSGAQHRVAMPEAVYAINTSGPFYNAEYDTTVVRFNYSSLVTPPRAYDYDMVTHELRIAKQQEVPGYTPNRYRVERLWATASDGVQVPISLVSAVDFPRDHSRPFYLYAYGSYGAVIPPDFDLNVLPLLERGFGFAIAHIRGGGEMGRDWYQQGKVLTKRNSFTDFIACAEYLIAEGYTRPDRLVIKGRSAGGLLMGAVVTMRPDLFCAAIAGVPFVDVVNTSLDPSIPLVVNEYEEWGDPRIREQFEYMLSYSPYDNTTARAYPNILATAGLYDPRVQYWEPAKWVQKLRSLKTDANVVLLRTEMVGGHSGPTGRYTYLREIAFEYAFFIQSLDLPEYSNPI